MTDNTDENQDERSAAEELEMNDVTHVKLVFQPERWVTSYGEEQTVEDGDPIEYVVPVEDVLTADGELISERTYEMDELQEHENAPSAVRCWSGPFEISYSDFLSEPVSPQPMSVETVTAVVTVCSKVMIDGELRDSDTEWEFEVPAEIVLDADENGLASDQEIVDAVVTYEHTPDVVRQIARVKDWGCNVSVDAFRSAGDVFEPDEINWDSLGGKR